MNDTYDVIIVGGGIVGTMVARFLSRYRLGILLIEKEADVCMGTTSGNSAYIHAGYDPLPGTLKAKYNVAGNAMWETLSSELGFSFHHQGDYVVALCQDDVAALKELMGQGKQNGVPGLELIPGDEMRRRYPMINSEVVTAMWAPTAGIVDPFGATIATAENAIQNGAEVALETAFQDFIMEGTRIVGVKTSRGDFHCRWVVNAAGLYADEVMHKAGVRPEFHIKPRRGEYYVFDRADFTLDTCFFPTPSAAGKGIVVTNTVHGNVVIGPNAQIIDDKEDRAVTPEGLEEILVGARKMIPSLSLRPVISMFAGSRAYGNAPCETPGVKYEHDFIVDIPKNVQGLVNLGGIESPGLTSAPAIAVGVVELLREAGEPLVEKKDWNPIRPARPHFKELSHEEQARLIAKDPCYGRVVCRCEMVTEGEIVAEIHAPLPARTYDAIKRRTWLGTGRCLGGFDMPRVVAILARELGVSPLEITKKGDGSRFLTGMTKQQAEV
ncbi:MAG TPA: NAD(P)/FAD-dependent oxidoreductase [Longilinea sp.]|nr:NAD(P)/FAD-dependent oxidoreductase [Longilinea sp.]